MTFPSLATVLYSLGVLIFQSPLVDGTKRFLGEPVQIGSHVVAVAVLPTHNTTLFELSHGFSPPKSIGESYHDTISFWFTLNLFGFPGRPCFAVLI